jgi:hypothetical protein
MSKIEIVDPLTGEVLEYDEAKIKKLKPGIAYGASDIQNWASRRGAGKDGVYNGKEIRKERKRALELSRLAGRPIKAFDGSMQKSAPIKKKKKHKSNRAKKNKKAKIRAHIQKWYENKAKKKEIVEKDAFLSTKLPWDY